MDLAKFDMEVASENGVEVVIRHPVKTCKEERINSDGESYLATVNAPLLNEDGSTNTITVLGAESAKWKQQLKKQRSRFSGKKTNDPDEFQKAMHEVLAECTISWAGVEWEGEPMECNKANALKLYSSPGHQWLFNQLMAAAGDASLIPLGVGDSKS